MKTGIVELVNMSNRVVIFILPDFYDLIIIIKSKEKLDTSLQGSKKDESSL